MWGLSRKIFKILQQWTNFLPFFSLNLTKSYIMLSFLRLSGKWNLPGYLPPRRTARKEEKAAYSTPFLDSPCPLHWLELSAKSFIFIE
jgi:hypothetical protein